MWLGWLGAFAFSFAPNACAYVPYMHNFFRVHGVFVADVGWLTRKRVDDTR